ncbi:hypothetical protein K2173_011265 [Erythroxylum novogranatense]|uniref:Uncharacterized protein n=1 Tax=Erythroxylum novogranatense TaxID=1862640 RepID=A0AAV8S940_9ROSI|nr:hypothetical protein K2173_011265 [Erythroxylum novogranatense]
MKQHKPTHLSHCHEMVRRRATGLGVDEKSSVSIMEKWHPVQRRSFRKSSPQLFIDEHHFERWDDQRVKLLKHEFLRFKEKKNRGSEVLNYSQALGLV